MPFPVPVTAAAAGRRTLARAVAPFSGVAAFCGTLLVIGALAGCASSGTGGDKPALAAGTYTVEAGDTLSSIARRSGQSVGTLAALNRLADVGDIKVGQVLLIGNRRGAAKDTQRGARAGGRDSAGAGGTAADNAEIVNPAAAGPAPRNWARPTSGAVTMTYEQNKKGIEIAGASGQDIRAANDGKVSFIGSGIRGYGNLLIVQHTGNLLSVYAHNRRIVVKEGQTVRKGEKIAEMGDSDSSAVKLYFEIRQNGKAVDPMIYLPAGN